MKTLNEYKKNIFSQFGEDGITEEILRRLNIKSGTCVEFGAWDGVLISNTALLWLKNNWRGILIEADNEKFETLKKVAVGYSAICLNEFVEPSGVKSLENILKSEKINLDEIFVISIDIDGNEYQIIENFSFLHPPLMIVEYNPTIPSTMTIVGKENAFFGSSANALVHLAESKGYKLVALTKNNCFFVDKKHKDLFDDVDTTFGTLLDESCLTYLITGYKGAYAFSQSPAFGIGLPLTDKSIEKGDLYYLNYSVLKVRWNYFKDGLKKIGKKIIGIDNIEKFRSLKGYFFWILKNKPIPAHGRYKWKMIKSLAKKYGIEVFIETGTAGGGTVLEMENNFKSLYTIELDSTLFHQGRARIENKSKIKCLEGDSGIILDKILKELKSPALFWLDAHYSGNGTAQGKLDTPIVAELSSIFTHQIKKHIILIDDAREFNGVKDYPRLEEIEKIVISSGDYVFSKNNDLLIIEPK